jgi:hypothetical protein
LAKIKNPSKNAGKYVVKRKKSQVEIEKEEESSNENKLYWTKIIVGFLGGLLGTLAFNLVGWWMFLYMIILWLIFPFIPNLFIMKDLFKESKKEWLKMTLKTGVGGFFFVFMVTSTFCYTLMNFQNFTFPT